MYNYIFQHNVYFCAPDHEADSKSTPLLSIILPVVISFTAIIITIAAIMIVLRQRRKQDKKRSHDFPHHIYDMPDITYSSASQSITQSKIEQSKTAMSVISTLDTELSLNKMKSPTNVADQQRFDVPPGGVETSDMTSNIAYGCVASDQCRAREEHSSEVSTL